MLKEKNYYIYPLISCDLVISNWWAERFFLKNVKNVKICFHRLKVKTKTSCFLFASRVQTVCRPLLRFCRKIFKAASDETSKIKGKKRLLGGNKKKSAFASEVVFHNKSREKRSVCCREALISGTLRFFMLKQTGVKMWKWGKWLEMFRAEPWGVGFRNSALKKFVFVQLRDEN